MIDFIPLDHELYSAIRKASRTTVLQSPRVSLACFALNGARGLHSRQRHRPWTSAMLQKSWSNFAKLYYFSYEKIFNAYWAAYRFSARWQAARWNRDQVALGDSLGSLTGTSLVVHQDNANYFCEYAFLYHQMDMLEDRQLLFAVQAASAMHCRFVFQDEHRTGSYFNAITRSPQSTQMESLVSFHGMTTHLGKLMIGNALIGNILRWNPDSFKDKVAGLLENTKLGTMTQIHAFKGLGQGLGLVPIQHIVHSARVNQKGYSNKDSTASGVRCWSWQWHPAAWQHQCPTWRCIGRCGVQVHLCCEGGGQGGLCRRGKVAINLSSCLFTKNQVLQASNSSGLKNDHDLTITLSFATTFEALLISHYWPL